MTFEESIFLAAPAFLLLIGIEYVASRRLGKTVYGNLPDAISSISSGIANATTGALGIGIAVVSYNWLLDNFALFSFNSHTPLTWVLVILGLDFGGYWGHRFSHRWNFLWQVHVVHHSSEEFNLPCALRQTVSGHLLKLLAIFMLPLAILGIPIEIIGAVGLVHFFYQYWYHTQLIGNLGWLERVLVTPQQHAIHHAMNPQYIDKNFGQWFSVWDQLFGTYQRPIPGVQPVFGVTQPARTWNPIRIDFMIWIQMLRDFLSTRTLRSKLGVLISRPGERPADAAALQPVTKIDDVYHFAKFRPRISAWVVRFCVLELLLAQFLMLFFFYWITRLSHTEVLAFGGFILLHIAAYTTVMEGHRATFLLCSRLAAYLVLLLYWQGDWFGINALTAAASAMLALYFAFTIAFAYIANARGTVASENAGLRDASPVADAGALAQ